MTVTTSTPLSEVCEHVDFRHYFIENHEDEITQDKSGNLLMDYCPKCGSYKKCYVYIGNVFCQKCRTRWGMYDYLTAVERMDKPSAIFTLTDLAQEDRVQKKRGERHSARTEVSEEDVEYMNDYAYDSHANLSEEAREWWHSRGVSDLTIQKFQLGERNGWYIIPLRDDYGVTFGIKKRWKGTKEDSPHKTRYECTRGSKVQYAPYILRGTDEDVAIIVGGEIKALCLWSYFQERNIPWNVVSVATGEGPWMVHWNEYMKFNKVAVWGDRDETGFAFSNTVRSNFRSDALSILPEDTNAKACDDFILEGGDAIKEIATVLNLREYQ